MKYMLYQVKDRAQVEHLASGREYKNKEGTHICKRVLGRDIDVHKLDRDPNLPVRFLDKPPAWFSYQNMWVKQTIDQSAHFLWAFVATLIGLSVQDPVLGYMFIGMHYAAILYREYRQWPPRYWWDVCLDLLFYVLGGYTAFVFGNQVVSYAILIVERL